MEKYYLLRTKRVLWAVCVFCLLAFSAACASNAIAEYSPTGNYPLVGQTGAASKSTLTVLMYHNVLAKGKKESVYCIGEDALERDFEYLENHGYNVVSCAEIIDAVYAGERLPERAVLLTFDDGYLNNVKYALPLLRKYGYTALFSVVGDYTLLDKSNPSVGGDFVYLGWKDIKEASESENVEIGLHSYSMHNLRPRLGVAQLKSESDEEYARIFGEDTDKLSRALYNIGAVGRFYEIYAYPYGKYNSVSERVLKEKGIKMTLTCNEGVNRVSSPEDLYLLKRLNRDATKSSLAEILMPYDKL